jgi:hypothetical protein
MSGFDPSAGGGVDNRLNNYILEHSRRVVLDAVGGRPYPGSLWSPPMFHPAEGTLALSENLLGTAPIYWLYRTVLGEWRAMQAWTATGFVLTYLAFAWSARRLGANGWLAATTAYLFAFGMPRLAQHFGSHDQLVPQLFLPLAIVAGWSFVTNPRHRTLVATLGLLAWQFATSVYLGWFGFLAAAAVVPLAYGRKAHRSALWDYLKRSWPAATGIVAGFAVVMAALVWPYVKAAEGFAGWGGQYIANTLPRWHSYLRPADGTLWWPVLRDLSSQAPDRGYPVELALFLGFAWIALLGLAVTAVVRRRLLDVESRWLVGVLLVAAMGLTLATFKLPTGQSPWWHLHGWLPGGESIRSVARVWTATYLLALLAVAVGASAWWRVGGRRLRIGLAVVTGLAVMEQAKWHGSPTPTSSFDADVAFVVSEVREAGLTGEDVFYLLPPDGGRDEPAVRRAHLVAMWASLATDIPTANGYSARGPVGYPAERLVVSRDAIESWAGTPVRIVELKGDG